MPKDQSPIVPALKPLYEKYEAILDNLENSKGGLANLIETAHNDEFLRHLSGISLRKTIPWEIGFCKNLDMSPQGPYIFQYNPECITEDKETREYSKVLEILTKKFPEMHARKLQEGVLDYINTCLFSPYSSDTKLKKTDEGFGWDRFKKIKSKTLQWIESEKTAV